MGSFGYYGDYPDSTEGSDTWINTWIDTWGKAPTTLFSLFAWVGIYTLSELIHVVGVSSGL